MVIYNGKYSSRKARRSVTAAVELVIQNENSVLLKRALEALYIPQIGSVIDRRLCRLSGNRNR
jgi:hypothetical protein